MKTLLALLAVIIPSISLAGNTTIDSFSKAKKLLMNNVYYDHRETLYCGAKYDANKHISLPAGFETNKYVKRSKRVEWEHVTNAESFGRTFTEWRDGHAQCFDRKGKAFKGRNCASKVNMEYRYMQADMYNLFPSVGAVNAMRSNYNFGMLPDAVSDFGSCQMKIDNRKAEPPAEARGRIARAHLYMDSAYERFKMSKSQRQLMQAWDKQYPVSPWECERARRIEKLQGNKNEIMAARCQ